MARALRMPRSAALLLLLPTRSAALLLLLPTLSLGCAIEDGSAFGAPYSIAASPLPRIDGSDVVFTATYTSPCDGGGSEFEAQRFTSEDAREDAPAILQQNLMVVAVRHAPACASPSAFEREVTLEVRTPLPASARAFGAERMLACPPGSSFDMVKLSTAASTTAPTTTAAAAKGLLGYYRRSAYSSAPPSRPADWDEDEDGPWEAEGAVAPEGLQAQAAKTTVTGAGSFLAGGAPLQGGGAPATGEKLPREDEEAATEEEEGARVARELATHSAADSVAFLAHCEQMIAQKQAWGCCSSRMVSIFSELNPNPNPNPKQAWGCCSSRMVSELRKKVAEEQGEEQGEEHNASLEPGAGARGGVAVDALGGLSAASIS